MAAKLARLTINWTISANRERASIGLFWLSPSGQDLTALDGAVSTPLANWWSAQKTLHTSGVALTGYRLDLIDITNGHVLQGQDGTWATVVGTAAGTSAPAEVATVVSLGTPFSGASYRGRVYLPCYATSTFTTEGDLATTERNNTATQMATFISSVNADVSADYSAVVYSRKLRATTVIDRLSVGNIFDVHRSRRRSLVENRYKVNV